MASSEVEVVSSSPSPFGCVLKDHNLRNRRPPTSTPATSKGQPNLQKTLKELVREHLRSSISPSSNENSNSNHHHQRRGRSPNHKASSDTEATTPSLPIGRRKTKGDFKRSPSPALSDSSISCLVQKWRVLETSDPKQLLPIQDPVRSNSVGFDNDSTSDCESDQIGEGGDKEKIRVVDIIRKLPLEVPLKQLRMPECGEGTALFSPRIRGRQALADLLDRLARHRYEEVEALAQLHTVSNFSKRGRIQSLLKIRLLTRIDYQEPRVYESSKAMRQRLSSVKSLRRRFNTPAAEQNGSDNAASSKMDQVSTSNEVSLGQISDETPQLKHREKLSAAAETTNYPQEQTESNIQLNEEKENLETANISVAATTETINDQHEEAEILDTIMISESDIQQTEEEENSVTEVVQQDKALLQAETEDVPQQIPSSDVVWQENETEKEAIQCVSPGRAVTLSHNVWEEDDEEEMFEEEEYYYNDFFESSLDWIHDISRPRSYWESQRQSWYEEILESESSTKHEIRQLIQRGSVSAVLTSDFRDMMDQLMIASVQLQMDPTAREDEERPMVCRGSVSAVLKSDFRDKMDQLMTSSVQLKMDSIAREDEEEEEQNQDHEHRPVEEQLVVHGQESSREVEPIREEAIREEDINENEDIEEEDEEEERLSYYREQTPVLELPWGSYQEQEDSDDLEQMQSAIQHQESFITNSYDHDSQVGEQLVIHGQESREVEPVPQEEDMDENEDIEEEDEEESLSYYREQTPVLELPWSSYQDQEEDSDGGDGLEQIEPETHRQQSFITNSYNNGSQVGSSVKNGSITEMELICDIRAHMQQIYREMSELRKVVSSCMDMQLKFQSSIRDEVSAAISHLAVGKTEGKESKRKLWKGSCCICREKKADSLLYRCGHMCTCFECGNKLQWSSGKCPICWAQIADVVRVSTD